MRKTGIFVIIISAVFIGIVAVRYRSAPEPKVPLPAARSYQEDRVSLPDMEQAVPKEETSDVLEEEVAAPLLEQEMVAPSEDDLPHEVNLAVPFTVQAPHANWDLPYQEYCEEASVLMAAYYILGKDIPNPDFADARLHEIRAFQEERFGYYEDTTAEETAVILREYYDIAAVEVVYEPTVDQIRTAVAAGKVVLVPAAGRMLPNPYFRDPGPLYHMLVIKGYLADGRFIVNDPGTKRGADFIYDPSALLNAVHDWNNGNVDQGRKVMIVVG